MNQTSSSPSSSSSSTAALSPDAVSRRAYELWESEGRPEGCELRHWLQAEQELGQTNSEHGFTTTSDKTSAPASDSAARYTDTQPLQGTRAAQATARDGKESKRSSRSPFASEKSNGAASASGAPAKRK